MNSRQRLIESITRQFGYSYSEADHIIDVLLDAKLLKIDGISGGHSVIHGAVWEPEVMKRAVNTDLPYSPIPQYGEL